MMKSVSGDGQLSFMVKFFWLGLVKILSGDFNFFKKSWNKSKLKNLPRVTTHCVEPDPDKILHLILTNF